MNGVYGKRVKPLDVRLVRGDSERLGGWWRRRDLSTGEITPVDLSAWSGRIELRNPDGTLWYSRACDEMTDVGSQVDAASKLGLAGVAYVFLMAGITDSYDSLGSMRSATAAAVRAAAKAWPGARVVAGVAPGCLTGLDDTALERMELVWTAIRLGAEDAGALVCDGLWKVCGSDTALCSSGGLPNDDGHALLAESIEASVREDQGEPLDQPIADLTRVVASGGGDWLSRSLRESRRREAEKREANRPTGTELSNITSKLEDVTKGQALMQAIQQQMLDHFKQQQETLEKQQRQLETQQDQLKQQNDQLKRQQETLTGIVGQQGDTVESLKSITAQLASQQTKIQQTITKCYGEFEHLSEVLGGQNIIYSPMFPPSW